MPPEQEEDSALPSAYVNEGPVMSRVWKFWSPVWKLRHKQDGRLFPWVATFWMLLLLSPYMLTNRIAAFRDVTTWDPNSATCPRDKLNIKLKDNFKEISKTFLFK